MFRLAPRLGYCAAATSFGCRSAVQRKPSWLGSPSTSSPSGLVPVSIQVTRSSNAASRTAFSVLQWLGQRTGVPKLVWEVSFGLWWSIPALFAVAVLLMESSRKGEQVDWINQGS